MIGDCCYRACKSKIKLVSLVMTLCDCVLVVEDRAYDIIDCILAYVVACYYYSSDSNCLAVFVCAVYFSFNCVRAVIRRRLKQDVNMLVIN